MVGIEPVLYPRLQRLALWCCAIGTTTHTTLSPNPTKKSNGVTETYARCCCCRSMNIDCQSEVCVSRIHRGSQRNMIVSREHERRKNLTQLARESSRLNYVAAAKPSPHSNPPRLSDIRLTLMERKSSTELASTTSGTWRSLGRGRSGKWWVPNTHRQNDI